MTRKYIVKNIKKIENNMIEKFIDLLLNNYLQYCKEQKKITVTIFEILEKLLKNEDRYIKLI